MCENRVLGEVSRSGGEKTRNWRKLHDVELHYDLYRSVNVTGVLKPRRKRWAGHVACIGQDTYIEDTRWKNLTEEGDLEDLGINGSVILKRILHKEEGRA
jgi:hypothetical protein